MRVSSPAYDTEIPRRYSIATLEQKVQNKLTLQRELGWPQEPRRPLLCLPAGMTDELGGALLLEILPGILSLPVELLILGQGSHSYGSLFTKLAKEQGHRVAIVPTEEHAMRRLLAASDIALFFRDPTHLSELYHCLSYGIIPIAPEVPCLENYDPVQESGDAFLYPSTSSPLRSSSFEGQAGQAASTSSEQSPWHFFGSLVRALETYKLPFDWRTIQRHGMEKVRSSSPRS
jgi:starch synthase